MKVRMISMLTGEENIRDIDVTQEDLVAFWEGTKGLVQEAFPHLSAEDREFIMTGISPDEWATYIIEPDDDEAEFNSAATCPDCSELTGVCDKHDDESEEAIAESYRRQGISGLGERDEKPNYVPAPGSILWDQYKPKDES